MAFKDLQGTECKIRKQSFFMKCLFTVKLEEICHVFISDLQ